MIGEARGGVDLSPIGSPVPPDAAASGAGAPSRGRRTPVRTCVGCRGQGGRSDMVRVDAVQGLLVPDPRARAAGRGAWLHPDPACLDLAERRRAMPRALRVPGPLEDTAVRAEIERRHDEFGTTSRPVTPPT